MAWTNDQLLKVRQLVAKMQADQQAILQRIEELEQAGSDTDEELRENRRQLAYFAGKRDQLHRDLERVAGQLGLEVETDEYGVWHVRG